MSRRGRVGFTPTYKNRLGSFDGVLRISGKYNSGRLITYGGRRSGPAEPRTLRPRRCSNHCLVRSFCSSCRSLPIRCRMPSHDDLLRSRLGLALLCLFRNWHFRCLSGKGFAQRVWPLHPSGQLFRSAANTLLLQQGSGICAPPGRPVGMQSTNQLGRVRCHPRATILSLMVEDSWGQIVIAFQAYDVA